MYPHDGVQCGLLVYMTNYATKHDVSQHQLILTAAILKRALEDAKSVEGSGISTWTSSPYGPSTVYAVTAKSVVPFYTPPTTVRRLNLRHLRYQLDHILVPEPSSFGGGEETTRVTIAKKAPTTFFEHYCWRGPSFSGLCLYDFLNCQRSDRRDADNIPSLRETDAPHATAGPEVGSVLEEFTMSSADGTPLGASSDFHHVRPDTLQEWRQRLSADGSDAQAEALSDGEGSGVDTDQVQP
ncbi:hypothetical protein V8E54_002008 [Elaphomyces granulatus]